MATVNRAFIAIITFSGDISMAAPSITITGVRCTRVSIIATDCLVNTGTIRHTAISGACIAIITGNR
jgi:hypothetical protein